MSVKHPNPRDNWPTEAELLFQALTQDEWKLVYAVDWLARSDDYGGHFSLTDYATPGKEDERTVAEDFKRAIRWLHFEHGVDFEGLEIRQNGTFGGSIVCPENRMYFEMLKYYEMTGIGLPPDFLHALQTAITVLEERAPKLNLEVFRAAMADLRMTLATRPEADPLDTMHAEEAADAALATWGVSRQVH